MLIIAELVSVFISSGISLPRLDCSRKVRFPFPRRIRSLAYRVPPHSIAIPWLHPPLSSDG